jgi:endogenous inhibitor of DNA gyrase (YacG/DUF329 family)
MQYPAFRDQGWPIGSGMVESANKNVVEARLKGSGMHWERSHVNPLLALRAAICNERWQEIWQQAITHQRGNCSQHTSSAANADVCLCGTPLVRFRGHRPKRYCSDRCRQRAHRKRQATRCSARPLPSQLKPEAQRKQRHPRSQQLFVKRDAQTCPCGTPLVRQRGHRPREYCSDRCRQRAHRERHLQAESLPHWSKATSSNASSICSSISEAPVHTE